MATTTQMAGRRRRLRLPGRAVLDNLGARLVALAALALVTILVARYGGADDVGVLALMRLVPGLLGVLAACGLPGAMGYFLAGPDSAHPALWPTIIGVMTAGAVGGTVAWLALVPLIHGLLLPTTTSTVVLLTGATVATQLPVAVAKASLQGLGDTRGANIVMAAEEAAFLPLLLIGYLAGLTGPLLLVLVLLAADVVVAVGAWLRLARQVHRRGMHLRGRPSRALTVSMVHFGMLGQVGGIIGLLNMRLDFLILGALAGPGPTGVYAVASKYGELLRLPALAVTWVAYPRVARDGAAEFLRSVRRHLPRLLAFGVLASVVLAAAAPWLFPLVYGPEFAAAVVPAVIIAFGLVVTPAGGLASAYLLGTRRPGTNSMVLGVGLGVTLLLDLALIPPLGATGAAVASAAAYLATDVGLLVVARRLSRGPT